MTEVSHSAKKKKRKEGKKEKRKKGSHQGRLPKLIFDD